MCFLVARITPWWNVITYEGYKETISAAQEDSPAAGLAGLQSKTQSSNIWILVCDHSGRSSSHLNIYTLLFFIQLISLSGSCRFRAVPAQVLRLWADWNGKPICSRWWVCFFLMKHICVSSIVKHLFSKAPENLRWLPGNKMDVFHHCIHEFLRFFGFFSNLEGGSCSSV